MNNQQNQISSLHLGLIVLSAQIGAGIIIFPTLLTKQVGHDGWITILITGLLATGVGWAIMALLNRYRDCSIYEINLCLFGKRWGQILNYGLLLYLLGFTISVMKLFMVFIQLYMLATLPNHIVMPLILLPTFFLTKNGLRSIGRFSFFLLVILAGILILVSLQYPNLRMTFYKPVGLTDWKTHLMAVPAVFYAFIGLELATFLYPAVRDRRQAMKWIIIANSFSVFFFTIVYLVSIGSFGEAVLFRLVAPLFTLTRTLKLPLIERVDLFFFLLWFPLLESGVRSYFAAAFDGLGKLFHVKNTYLNLVLFTGILIIASLKFIPGEITNMFGFTLLSTYVGIGINAYLVVCFLLSFIRRKEMTSE